MATNPINIPTGGQSPVQQVHHHGHHGGGARKAGMDAAAQALGMSTSDLQSALRGGQSLTSLAQSKGISTDTLTSSISAAISKANPSLSSDRAQQLAQRIVNGPTNDNQHG